MRVAIVDLGTNTFNLLIAEITKTGFTTILKEKRAVKLGKSGLKTGMIQPDAFQRGVQAMIDYKRIIDQHNVSSIKAIATSAMRDSSNSDEFQNEIDELTGIQIEIISGDREAALIQKGVAQTLPIDLSNYMIMDVGGGSTEFIIVKNKEVIWSKSYDLGVSRLLDWLQPSDPINSSEIDRLKKRLKSELNELVEKVALYNIDSLIGSSGSFDSIHDILKWEESKDFSSNDTDFNEINLQEFLKLNDKLVRSTLLERLELNGLVKMRADMMVISSLEILQVLTSCKISHLFRSSFALKEGLITTIR